MGIYKRIKIIYSHKILCTNLHKMCNYDNQKIVTNITRSKGKWLDKTHYTQIMEKSTVKKNKAGLWLYLSERALTTMLTLWI